MTHAMQDEGVLRPGPIVIAWVINGAVVFQTERGARFDPTSKAGLRRLAFEMTCLAEICRDYESVRPLIGERKFLSDLGEVLRAITPGWPSRELDWITSAERPDDMLPRIISEMSDKLQVYANEYDRLAAWEPT